MQSIDTLIHARWIIPVEPDGELLEHHSIAVHNGTIEALLPQELAVQNYSASNEVALNDHVLIPGFVNAHTHAAMSLFRGMADDLALMEWLQSHIWPAERRWVSPHFVRDGTRLAIAEMLRGGTTCFNDMYFFPDEVARLASDIGMRAVVGLIAIDAPTAWAADTDEYLSKGTKVHDAFRHDPLIHTAFAPHAPYTVSDDGLTRIRTLADELDLPVHMHVHETRSEVEDAAKADGVRPLARLERLGLLTNRLVAVHMTQLTPDEISQVAANGVNVVHCPESNLKLASGFCPVVELSEAGINVALGTDGAASNNDLDMLAEMRTAAYLGKGLSGRPSALNAMSALKMATLNGAKALGIGHLTGSLLPGKSADLTAVDLSWLETQPTFNPCAQIVYSASRHQVSDVWVAGQRLLDGRQLTTIDEQLVLENALDWKTKLTATGASDDD
jgi:5-methylthioadenosine/S-adenosylhomocysteine deaminase